MDHQFDESYPFVSIGHVWSSVQNFCSPFSDIILWGTSAGVVKCWPFSQAELICYIFWNIFSALAENLANENILRKVNKSI